MEQREHFALVRHAEACDACSARILTVLQEAGQSSRYWRQSLNCGYCDSNLPIARLRFENAEKAGSQHIAICEKCYEVLRPEMLRAAPNMVTFMEKEWLTIKFHSRTRIPWPKGTIVKVVAPGTRQHDKTGWVDTFRCLIQPWFGYTVRFEGGRIQFYHERDLERISPENDLRPQQLPASVRPAAARPAARTRSERPLGPGISGRH